MMMLQERGGVVAPQPSNLRMLGADIEPRHIKRRGGGSSACGTLREENGDERERCGELVTEVSVRECGCECEHERCETLMRHESKNANRGV